MDTAQRVSSTRYTRVAVTCGLIGLCAWLQACTTPVKVSDTDARLGSLRAAKTFKASPPETAGHVPQSTTGSRSGHAIEFNIIGGGGEDEIDLPAGKAPIVFGSTTFVAPETVKAEFHLTAAELVYRWRKSRGPIGFELVAGVGYGSIDADLTTDALKANDAESQACPAFGLGLLWNISARTSLEGRGLLCGTEAPDTPNYIRGDLVFAFAVAEHLQVNAGWSSATWSNWFEPDDEFKLGGLTLGLSFEY